MLCSNDCKAHSLGDGGDYANNKYCQDGAADDDIVGPYPVTGNTCAYGTDCADCGPRYPNPKPKPRPNPSPSPNPDPNTQPNS